MSAPDEAAVAALTERLCRKLAATTSDSLRSRAAATEVSGMIPGTAALVLGQLVRLARDRPVAATALGAVDRPLMRGEIEPEHTAAILACAQSRADRLVEALFAAGPAVREYNRHDEQLVDRKMKSLTLGERRALSRSRDIDKLVRLAHDQDPRVIAELLQNPRFTEREVVIIASRRPTHVHVLEAVLASRFGGLRRVRRAIAHNPYSSVAQAVRALATLTRPELRLVADDEHVSPEVRRHAAALAINKRATPAERDTRPRADADPELHAWLSSFEAESEPLPEGLEVEPIDIDGRPVERGRS